MTDTTTTTTDNNNKSKINAPECTVSVYDQTPGSQQKKINVVLRSHYTVQHVINLIGTQFPYGKFELILQPHDNKDLVHLNNLESQLLYEVAGFEHQLKNSLVLLPSGSWDGNVTKRFELPLKKAQGLVSLHSKEKTTTKSTSPVKKDTTTGSPTKKEKSTETSSSTLSSPIKKEKSDTKKEKKEITTTTTTASTRTTTSEVATETIDILGETTATISPNKKKSSVTGETIKKKRVTTTTTGEKSTTTTKKKSSSSKAAQSTSSPSKTKSTIQEEEVVVVVDDNNDDNEVEAVRAAAVVAAATTIIENGTTKITTSTSTSTTTTATSCYGNNMSIDEITKAEISDQLPPPQNRILISPIDDHAPSELFNISPVSDAEQLSDDDLALGASASPTTLMMDPFVFGGDVNNSLENRGANGDQLVSSKDVGLDGIGTQDGQESDLSNFYRRKYGGDDLPSWQKIDTTAADFVASATTEREGGSSGTSTTGTATGTSSSSAAAAAAGGGASSSRPSSRGYVGLINQAMTCYLNSLLQALYMTPEFRNALYRWEFDNDNEAKNIPYQLQKLFLNLQTSHKSSVETTDLTRSFGWDSTEAWQQHDIQELCRVMFDALEHKFKNTKQANLISTLYEGKMNDYVKCLECNTEKTREDTFLDIPLPVRPFGSSSAYGSIEEALRAFVRPETLDGNNQYLCEKCKKKCDAHKGLHFKSFPYILTLHLKRFDFDYQTMHRIKLNDRVTFPQKLNLNTFINRNSNGGEQYQMNGHNLDDCSTADSGSAMEEDNLSSGVVTTASSSQHENDLNDEDEGIDMSSSTSKSTKQDTGPYMYELFAIMIHSGSASGGHYYAYIKDFDNQEWFCFNDQNVSTITQEDIQRSFGGPNGSYYSSAYTSSTNAYMLMYRQVDAKRNERVVKSLDFPEHIKSLLPKLHAEEETRVTRLGRHVTGTDLALPHLYKPRVYFYNPSLKKLKVTRVYVSSSFDINSVLSTAYEMLNVEQFAPLNQCRLVAYNSSMDTIIQSLESCTDPSLTELRASQNFSLDFLLEYRLEDQQFEVYEPDGSTWYVYKVELSTMSMDGPFLVYSAARESSDVLRHSIATRLHIKDEDQFLLVTVRGSFRKAFVAYDPQPTPEAQLQLQNLANTQFKNITYFYLNVPNTDAASLEMLGVPSKEVAALAATTTPTTATEPLSGGDVVDAALMNGSAVGEMLPSNDCDWRRYKGDLLDPLSVPPGHESNSEDSSLSDGDRTLVETESLQHRGGGDSQVSSTSHSPQLSSPEDEAASHDAMMRVHAYCNGNGSYSAADAMDSSNGSGAVTNHFFHASKIDCVDIVAGASSSASSGHLSDDEANLRKPTCAYKLLVGTQMRMGVFKRHIEQLIKVPNAYFKLQRKNENNIPNNQNNLLISLNEGETLTVELGKTLQPDEYKAKIHFLRLSDLDNETARLPCVCEWVYNTNTTVEQAKQELVAKLQRIDSKYSSLTVENSRIWLKGGRSLIKIMSNDETLYCDMRSTTTTEFIIQECEEGIVTQPSEDALTIFVRQWYPQKMEFGKFQEVTLEKDNEIRRSLSQICDITIDKLSYMKVNSNFPCTNISAVSINESSSWFSVPGTLDTYPLNSSQTGNMYLYKDKSIAARELTLEERRQMSAKEKARLDRLGCISTTRYSQRRERALKIYLDSPEKSNNVSASAPMDAHVEH
ncbi:ubiquitin carboxyl-terminal hydrolase 47 isoform X1 [Drosophila tropicalis]|uniref:ubiquitin carboxyl-terminal hydrolase 47 isoform X1 n=1 Tax=Drosophila tropicalis TaxID=46794 RepID=UPI0035AB7C94